MDSTTGKNVILLGWDGVQRNHLLELMDKGLMPNLSSFLQNGTMVNVTITDHFTDTKAGWTQILTGYKWWRTQVFNNYYWFHAIPRGYTIPERLESIYGKDQIFTAFIAGKLNHMETVDGTGSAAPGSPLATYTHEAIYDNLPSQLDVVDVGDPTADRYANIVGPLTLQFLQNNGNKRFFAFFHFSDPDHIGHSYGENSDEYSNTIETCDYWLGQILTELNTLNIAQNTLIYITADHGFDEGSFSHFNAPYVFLATNDNNVVRNGDQVDVAPTVYYGLGLWNQSFSPLLDGYPLQVNLSAEEEQHRDAILADTSNVQTPSLTIADGGSGMKRIEFSAADNNLATVLLLVDNTLKADGPWNWTRAGIVRASGSYPINATSLSDGLHTVKVLAFDEHGANNGGLFNDPKNGGGPSISYGSFYVGASPPPVPDDSIAPFSLPPYSLNPAPAHPPSNSPSPVVSEPSVPSLLPYSSPLPASPFLKGSSSSSQREPLQEFDRDGGFPLAATSLAVTIVVVGLAIGVFLYSKRMRR